MGYLSDAFPFLENCNTTAHDREINLVLGKNLVREVNIPSESLKEKSFSGPHYYVWREGDVTFSYSPQDEWRGAHLVRNDGKTFFVNTHKSETEEIAVRVSREIILRDLLDQGYFPIHGAVVCRNNLATVFFGDSGSGKSTAFFSSLLLKEYHPMSSDVAFIKKESSKNWSVLGWPWKASIRSSFFEAAGKKVPFIETREKVRFTPRALCEEYGLEWQWKANVLRVVNTQLSINSAPVLHRLDQEQALHLLGAHALEKSWTWADVFSISNRMPSFDFNSLSRELSFYRLTGDIISFFKKDNPITKLRAGKPCLK